MANKFLDNNGLTYFWQKIKEKLNNKVDKVEGKALSTNDYTTAEKNKLSGIAEGANKTVVDSTLSTTSTNPVQNKVINTALSGKANTTHTHKIADVTNLQTTLDGKASTDPATQSANGLMSKEDKTKLDGISADATESRLSDMEDNLRNMATDLANKVDAVDGKGLSTNDYTTNDKNKLTALYNKAELDALLISGVKVDHSTFNRGSDGYVTLDLSTYAKKSDVSGLFKYKGSVAVVPPLTQYTFGSVFNISDEFTTDVDFVEGAGKKYPAGTNIVIVDIDNIGTNPTKKWDVLGGTFDFSSYMLKADMVAITNSEIDTILAS